MVAVWDGTHFDVQIIPGARKTLLLFIQKSIVLVLIMQNSATSNAP